MKTKFTLTIALQLFVWLMAYGQGDANGKYNSIMLDVGIDNIALKDQTFSPSVFSGNIPNLGIGFSQKIGEKSFWSTSLSISIGEIDYKNQYFSSTYYDAQFSLNYFRKIKTYDRSKIYLGGQFKSILNLLDYDGFVSAGWFTSQQLEPALMYTYDISEKHSISGQLSYPIASLVSRPSYAGIDEFVVVNTERVPKILYSRTKLLSLNKLINPNLQLKYSIDLKRTNISVSADYSYLQVNSIRKYYKNNLGINLIFNMKIGKSYEQ